MKVKIYGAGSIGNHLAYASRSLGWEVHLCDIDEAALVRTKEQIYPRRYGKWDETIQLYKTEDAPRNIYDLICIGTPPEYHLPLAIDAIAENPKAILIEKPACPPDLARAQELYELAKSHKIFISVGYDHVVADATQKLAAIATEEWLGSVETIDVEFREHWGGIFNAHPWLSGPADTYLGYWQRGGGASGEHSHALNLWQHFAHLVGAGRVVAVSAMLDYVRAGKVYYDKICALNLQTESGLVGRVVQDVVTQPPKKWGRIQGDRGYIDWHCGYQPGCDAVFYGQSQGKREEYRVQKTRPDDFIAELKHLQAYWEGRIEESGIRLERGLDTSLLVAAAHLSAREGKTVRIDYSRGYLPEALQFS